MKDAEFIDGLIAGLKSPNFIRRREQIMFGRKSDSAEMKIENEETAKACDTCGCVVLTAKLKIIRDYTRFETTAVYYCGRCKPPYDMVSFGKETLIYQRRVPEHYIFVTKEGSEIIHCEKVKSKRVAKNTKE